MDEAVIEDLRLYEDLKGLYLWDNPYIVSSHGHTRQKLQNRFQAVVRGIARSGKPVSHLPDVSVRSASSRLCAYAASVIPHRAVPVPPRVSSLVRGREG